MHDDQVTPDEPTPPTRGSSPAPRVDNVPAADAHPARADWENSRGRRVGVRVLLLTGLVLGILSILAVWSSRQLFDNAQFKKTSQQLIQNPKINNEVANYLSDQLYANVNIQQEIAGRLPANLQPLAPAVAGAVRGGVDQLIHKALANAKFQQVWVGATTVSHAKLVALLNGGTQNLSTTNGVVTLDLKGLLTQVANRLGLSGKLVAKIPADAATIQVMKSNELKTAQDAAKLLKTLAFILGPLALLALALAVFLARGHRRQTLMAAGFAAMIAGLVVLIVRSIAGNNVTNALADESVKPAATAAWDISTSLLSSLAWQAIVIGIVLAVASWLSGPTSWATALRRRIAPTLNARQEIAYGIVSVLLLLVIWWSPLPGFQRPLFILVLIVAALFGVWALRRQTLEEFGRAGTGTTVAA